MFSEFPNPHQHFKSKKEVLELRDADLFHCWVNLILILGSTQDRAEQGGGETRIQERQLNPSHFSYSKDIVPTYFEKWCQSNIDINILHFFTN